MVHTRLIQALGHVSEQSDRIAEDFISSTLAKR